MTKIYNISAGFLQICENYLGKRDLSLEEVFKRLSLEMGGDGKKITKEQLDTYVNKAETGMIKIDKVRLNALKQIQKNWDNISKDGENITFEDMKGFESLLVATVVGTFTETDVDTNKDKSSFAEAILEYLAEYLGVSDKSEIKKSDLVDYLNKVLSESSETENFDTEMVDTLTNMIATYSTKPTIEAEA